MAIVMSTPEVDELDAVVSALREWQHEGAPMQLHSGDVGWLWRFGPEATAAKVRTWSRDGRMLAAGMADGANVVRMTIAPDAMRDEELAEQLFCDLTDPARGVLGEGRVALESPHGALVKDLLSAAGWQRDEPWSPLRRDLRDPVEDPGVRIAVVGPDEVADRVAVHRAAFDNSTFTEERWQAMAAGPAHVDARCLLAHDEQERAVAAVTVWSAGEGRPGLLEPMGVHRDHRGRGYGRAICVAAAAALQQMGASSALVCTLSSNVGGVATYVSAGYERLPEIGDLFREDLARGGVLE